MEHHGHEKWHSKLFRILNSTFCFAAAYLTICYLQRVVAAFVGTIFKFNAFIYYYGIKFIQNGIKWDRQNVVFVYISGPLFALLFGFLCVYFFARLKRFKLPVNLFFIWAFVIGVAIFLSQSVIASVGYNQYYTPFYTDWSVALAWIGIPGLLIYAMNLPYLLAMLYFSVNIAKPFLIFAYSYTKVNKLSRRRKYFVEIALLPFFIGSLVVMAVTFPLSGTAYSMNLVIHAFYIVVIAIILVIAWYALQYIEVPKDEVMKYKSLQSPDAISLVILILVILGLKLVWQGIYI